jgi:hypothetical protein
MSTILIIGARIDRLANARRALRQCSGLRARAARSSPRTSSADCITSISTRHNGRHFCALQRDTLLGDAMRNLYRRDNVVLACRVDVGVLRVVRKVLQAQARSCASVADARPNVSSRINWLHCKSIVGAQTQRDAAPAFSPHRSALLGVYVVVVVGLARRTESGSTRNCPAMAPSRYRFDLEISITWSLAGWTPADRPRDPPTDPRDGSREFSLGAPRIHGELLKLGITISQATVSRYMPTSRKGRRSQAWRTFIRNHAITITQSHGFQRSQFSS